MPAFAPMAHSWSDTIFLSKTRLETIESYSTPKIFLEDSIISFATAYLMSRALTKLQKISQLASKKLLISDCEAPNSWVFNKLLMLMLRPIWSAELLQNSKEIISQLPCNKIQISSYKVTVKHQMSMQQIFDYVLTSS